MIDALIVNVPGTGNNSYVQGDIVVVKPTGWQWGLQEHPSTRTHLPTDKFVLITIDGLTEEDVQEVLEVWDDLSEDGEPIIVQKRIVRLDFTKLKAAQRQELEETGLLTLEISNMNNLRQLMLRKDQ